MNSVVAEMRHPGNPLAGCWIYVVLPAKRARLNWDLPKRLLDKLSQDFNFDTSQLLQQSNKAGLSRFFYFYLQ